MHLLLPAPVPCEGQAALHLLLLEVRGQVVGRQEEGLQGARLIGRGIWKAPGGRSRSRSGPSPDQTHKTPGLSVTSRYGGVICHLMHHTSHTALTRTANQQPPQPQVHVTPSGSSVPRVSSLTHPPPGGRRRGWPGRRGSWRSGCPRAAEPSAAGRGGGRGARGRASAAGRPWLATTPPWS